MSKNSLEGDWIDVTVAVFSGMIHWPGDPDVEMIRVVDMAKGDHCNVTKLTMCTHTGTHIDAPLHFLRDGVSAEEAPLSVMMGKARVLEIDDLVSVRQDELERHHIVQGERLLFKTRNSLMPRESPFKMDFIFIAADAAAYLAEKKVSLVGIDGMSVGGFYHDMVQTHMALLEAGIWIVENLDLRQVPAGPCELLCLPMKLCGSDGAPARALVRPL